MGKQSQSQAKSSKRQKAHSIFTTGERFVFALCLFVIGLCILFKLSISSGSTETVIIYKDGSSGYSFSGSSTYSQPTSSTQSGKININTDGIDRLMQLTGIGEVRAQAIIDYRVLQGEFTCAEDLLKVDGIGEKILDNIRDEICF